MPKDFTATIREDSERAPDWEKILGSGNRTVYLKSPCLEYASLPGHAKGAFIYQLDVDLLEPEQRERLIEHLSYKFGIPKKQVEEELPKHGVPILADDVIVTIANPHRWS